MVLFQRRTTPEMQWRSAAVLVSPVDLAMARPVIVALGNIPAATDLQVRAALAGLLAASNVLTDPDERMRRMFDDPGMVQRPWLWLTAAAEQANAAGHHDLAALACVFLVHWTYVLGPKLKLADYLELGVDPAPGEQRNRLLHEGIRGASMMHPDRLFVGTEQNGLRPTDVLPLWRSFLQQEKPW
jgi:hypothetical protein